LILLADIGFDIFLLLVDALFEAFTRGLASQRPERTESLQLNCDIVPLIVIRPIKYKSLKNKYFNAKQSISGR